MDKISEIQKIKKLATYEGANLNLKAVEKSLLDLHSNLKEIEDKSKAEQALNYLYSQAFEKWEDALREAAPFDPNLLKSGRENAEHIIIGKEGDIHTYRTLVQESNYQRERRSRVCKQIGLEMKIMTAPEKCTEDMQERMYEALCQTMNKYKLIKKQPQMSSSYRKAALRKQRKKICRALNFMFAAVAKREIGFILNESEALKVWNLAQDMQITRLVDPYEPPISAALSVLKNALEAFSKKCERKEGRGFLGRVNTTGSVALPKIGR